MNVTPKTVTCRKCRAVGLHNFKRGPVYVEGGLCLDVVSCLICSDWYVHKPAALKMERQVAPVKDRGLATCYVAGCGNYISANPAQNKTGLCTTCSNKMTVWRAKGSKDLPPLIKTPTGYMTRVAFAALNPPEVNHVEPTVSPVSLVPPAPTTERSSSPAGTPFRGGRDHYHGVAELKIQRVLAAIALPAPLEVIATWSPAEIDEVIAFAAACNAVKRARKMPEMPEVLVPLYDELYAERKTA